ncbi:MAG: hypothetical protein COU11_04700 [Candidatus Harrisonbacteria bacterium CG10_big_fil_rev_8_21_14_0_10_49_15]|uniref:DUF4878 domain-containing protein n=1 Tax=Candidatus Harrisonbacteria bacterium CG10_big_fil_rev_8_21_14_0_10_49_15 TaxID=1974587 RepID=A0A2H0UJQ0_9BACT|nr:MAG: hypothetical protein COU11_04700 [Candidatus Harrisonbacteria bacterium CG10_big_fil_rev_8_21_14_0_10_49_15]
MLGDNRPPIHEAGFWMAVSRPSFLKFLIAFAIVLGGAWLGYYLWSDNRANMAEVEEYERIMDEYTAVHRNDTYGGATPQETLDLFIAALEAGDPELATMYFLPDDNGSREEWRKVMQDTYDAGNFPLIVSELKKAVPEQNSIIGDSFYGFIVRDESGIVVVDISLIFNGKIWKIDSV